MNCPIRDGKKEVNGMGFLAQMSDALVAVASNTVNVLPGIVGAIIVLILGYIIAAIVGWVVRELLDRVNLDKKIHQVVHSEVIGSAYLSGIIGTIIKWYVFLIFLGTSVELVELGVLTGFLTTVVAWLPNLIVSVILVLVALILAEYVAHKVRETKVKGAHWMSKVLYACIVGLVGIIALNQIGIDVRLLENLVLAIVGALAIGTALALGISLGLGLKDDARKFVKELKR
ncbi:hypothetical protein HYS47_02895 [Candidatus Woesearchaeota archaeon]|nr:hypothetical protein [Candidatus Woesearchaeota archaeon]